MSEGSLDSKWIGTAVNSYIEVVRNEALFYIASVTDENREDVFKAVTEIIDKQRRKMKQFVDKSMESNRFSVFVMGEVDESKIEVKYLRTITDLCIEFEREVMSIFRGLQDYDRLDKFPSISYGILVVVGEIHSRMQNAIYS